MSEGAASAWAFFLTTLPSSTVLNLDCHTLSILVSTVMLQYINALSMWEDPWSGLLTFTTYLTPHLSNYLEITFKDILKPCMSSWKDGGSKDNLDCNTSQIYADLKYSLEAFMSRKAQAFPWSTGRHTFSHVLVNKVALVLGWQWRWYGVPRWFSMLSNLRNPFSSTIWKANIVTMELKISLHTLLPAPLTPPPKTALKDGDLREELDLLA